MQPRDVEAAAELVGSRNRSSFCGVSATSPAVSLPELARVREILPRDALGMFLLLAAFRCSFPPPAAVLATTTAIDPDRGSDVAGHQGEPPAHTNPGI